MTTHLIKSICGFCGLPLASRFPWIYLHRHLHHRERYGYPSPPICNSLPEAARCYHSCHPPKIHGPTTRWRLFKRSAPHKVERPICVATIEVHCVVGLRIQTRSRSSSSIVAKYTPFSDFPRNGRAYLPSSMSIGVLIAWYVPSSC